MATPVRLTLLIALLAAALPGCKEDIISMLDDAAPPDAAPPDACVGAPPRIIFLNRGGGRYTRTAPGADDSATNSSSVLGVDSADVEAAEVDAAEWSDLLDCVRGKFAAFNVAVVDVDPGDTDHLEIVEVPLATWPELGFDPNPDISSVPPFACAGISRGIAFAKVDIGTAENNCINASFDAGVMLGLQVEISDDDIMSYSQAPTLRTFTDVVAPCGLFDPAPCPCGGVEQNTHQRLLERLGPPSCTL